MLRTHTCGELTLDNRNQEVVLCGWTHKIRNKGSIIWVDLRDRYGITQLLFEEGVTDSKVLQEVKKIGREYVLKIEGVVLERYAKNKKIATGDIEIKVEKITVLNTSDTPPFTIENNTDGGDDLRMKYRYLDIRRECLRKNLELRNQLLIHVREYLASQQFMEIETPYLIKSTPEGARDFLVPSRVNSHEFYALPQSPQTFKQLLMVAGTDKYFQIVKCFRDEDLRADRQPEFTQIDCEMSFVEQCDVLNTFEGLVKYIYKQIKNIELSDFQVMSYENALNCYGSDKPDLRFDMKFFELHDTAKGKGFKIFDQSEVIIGIKAENCVDYSRKQLDELNRFVQKPQIGARGLVYVKYNSDGTLRSSVDKFFSQEDLLSWAKNANANPGDLLLIICGEVSATRNALSELRLEMGSRLGLMSKEKICPVWIVDFPLLEWSEETQRFYAVHHPFTSPKLEDMERLDKAPEKVKANAYDLVINGVEAGGGSIRIHDRTLQNRMFKLLGFTDEEIKTQFGFIMEAFRYGAPPHGGIAFGLDRLCAILEGETSIRDFIAFPKNNAGRDIMIDSPSPIEKQQLDELSIQLK